LEILSLLPAVPDREDPMGRVMLFIAVSWMAKAMDFAETITVHVYNVAGARAAVIVKGEEEASLVFKWAGIAVRWVDCPVVDAGRAGNKVCVEPGGPYTFTVVIANGFAKTPIKDIALGFAMPFSAARNFAGISYPRLKQVSDTNPELVDSGGLLGAIMAHELAHLLLSSIRHGPGVMQANWSRAEFKCMGQRRFLFTPAQAQALRSGLRSRYSVLGPKLPNLMTAAPHQ
jgi:hypothetical protein